MSHYFENDNNVKSKEKKIIAVINNERYTFMTDNNVFAKRNVDLGTKILLESIDLTTLHGHILDFGCGYGPIGIYLAKHGHIVDMVDINDRALKLAKCNAKLNNVAVNIFESNIYNNINRQYHYIITNPPIRVGKKILHEILFGAYNYLIDGGHLILVIHKDQGAKTLVKELGNYYNVNLLNKNKGFWIIDCEK